MQLPHVAQYRNAYKLQKSSNFLGQHGARNPGRTARPSSHCILSYVYVKVAILANAVNTVGCHATSQAAITWQSGSAVKGPVRLISASLMCSPNKQDLNKM
jgi:hypothetical protein